MELRHLKYFIAVADELHFSRAADKLNMTQPPLSQQIRRLEAELEMKLFHRTKRRVELTPIGRTFLTEARAIFAHAEAAIARTKRVHRGEAGCLSVGWMPWSDMTALPHLIREFCERYPDVRLDVHNLSLHEQISALHAGKIDIGFLFLPSGLRSAAVDVKKFQTRVVLRHSLAVVLPQNHKLASQPRIELSELANEPYILFKRESGPVFYDSLISLYRRHGLSLNVRHEADHPSTVLGLVAAGLGITLLPFAGHHTLHGVVFRTLSPKFPPLDITLAWRSKNESALLNQFIETICEYGNKRNLSSVSDRAAARKAKPSAQPALSAELIRPVPSASRF